MNFSGGRVVETSFMFHAAWPASHRPALRPMRGSGLGGDTDMLIAAEGAGAVEAVEVELVHAAAATSSDIDTRHDTRDMGFVEEGVTATVPGW
jgi:hypothetical protein